MKPIMSILTVADENFHNTIVTNVFVHQTLNSSAYGQFLDRSLLQAIFHSSSLQLNCKINCKSVNLPHLKMFSLAKIDREQGS